MNGKFLDFEGWPRPPGWHSFPIKMCTCQDVTPKTYP